MLRRFLALTVTVAVLGAPLAAVVCRTVCALGAEPAVQQLHLCHGTAGTEALTQGPTDGPIANGVPHGCGHGEALPQALEWALQPLNAPIPLPVVAFASPVETGAPQALSLIQPPVQHSLPGLFPLISQQRI